MKLITILMLLGPLVCLASPIEAGFSPNQNSLNLVLQTINSAHKSICMAAYSFTSKPIAKAILAAKSRGVDIKIVADSKANTNEYSATTFLTNMGINVRLNNHYAIMHNKFIVADNQTVETGSFNYSNAAVYKNAENVLVIWNNPEIASSYNNECLRLFNEATPIKPH